MQQQGIARRAWQAGLWTLAGHGFSQALRLAGNLVLTRLLAPELFGLMTVATVISVGVLMFSDLGLRQVIVKSPEAADPDFLNTVWTLQVLQGTAVAALLLLIAGGIHLAQGAGFVPAASTYANTELPLLVAGLSLSAFVTGFESSRLAIAEKEMVVLPVILLELGAQTAALVAMILAALWHPSVFVMLLGAWVSTTTRTAASHLLLRGMRNRFAFSRRIAAQVGRLSSWIVVSSALTFLAANCDKLLLAWLLGAATMGQFAIATLLIGAMNDVVHRITSRVAFPAISQAYARNVSGLRQSYYRSRLPLDACCLSLAAFLFWFGKDVVNLLFDPRYSQAGEMLGILAITLLGTRYSVVAYVYLILGRPMLTAAEQGIRLFGLLVAITTGYKVAGPMGAIWGVAVGHLAGSLAGLTLFQPRLGLLSVRRELASMALFAGALGLFGYASHGVF